MAQARRGKHYFGGAMRQVGVFAAAAAHALGGVRLAVQQFECVGQRRRRVGPQLGHRGQIDSHEMTVDFLRPTNLEDVFLALTGRSLRD